MAPYSPGETGIAAQAARDEADENVEEAERVRRDLSQRISDAHHMR